MKIEHIAVAANSEQESDKFFLDLIGLKKARNFSVSADLMEQFFGIIKGTNAVRYEGENINVEVFLTEDDSKAKDSLTHNCLLVEDPEVLLKNAESMGFPIIKVPRKDTGYYYFILDCYGNRYEIKKI